MSAIRSLPKGLMEATRKIMENSSRKRVVTAALLEAYGVEALNALAWERQVEFGKHLEEALASEDAVAFITELSKNKLADYDKKARRDVGKKEKEIDAISRNDDYPKKGKDRVLKLHRKGMKRLDYVEKAQKKIKEENISEEPKGSKDSYKKFQKRLAKPYKFKEPKSPSGSKDSYAKYLKRMSQK